MSMTPPTDHQSLRERLRAFDIAHEPRFWTPQFVGIVVVLVAIYVLWRVTR